MTSQGKDQPIIEPYCKTCKKVSRPLEEELRMQEWRARLLRNSQNSVVCTTWGYDPVLCNVTSMQPSIGNRLLVMKPSFSTEGMLVAS